MRRLACLAVLIALPVTAATEVFAADWRQFVSAKLRAGQTMPRSAVIRGASCTARVRIAVDGNGLIQSYAIVKPCASPILTRSTDDLVFTTGQLPPPPTRRPASIEVDVSWPPTS